LQAKFLNSWKYSATPRRGLICSPVIHKKNRYALSFLFVFCRFRHFVPPGTLRYRQNKKLFFYECHPRGDIKDTRESKYNLDGHCLDSVNAPATTKAANSRLGRSKQPNLDLLTLQPKTTLLS